jgi:peptidoglycan/LPS O-acetylase OafA/YrhL
MPLFFLLSGFALAATYGATSYPSTAAFPTRAFLQNRAARVLPVYYACLTPCIGLWLLGEGPGCFNWTTFAASLASNILPVASALMPFVRTIDPMNAPSWFIQTIGMIWLAVPCLLPWAQKQPDRQLMWAISLCYYAQAALLCGLYWPLAGALGVRTSLGS